MQNKSGRQYPKDIGFDGAGAEKSKERGSKIMSEWSEIREEVIGILREHRDTSGDSYAFLSPYQVAILYVEKFGKSILKEKDMTLGGKGEGDHRSFPRYIANNLSKDFSHAVKPKIELAFLYTDGLEISYHNEKAIIRQPSNETFSIFRYAEKSEG
jgi:hypothetical protein